jgi:hypothetical protein
VPVQIVVDPVAAGGQRVLRHDRRCSRPGRGLCRFLDDLCRRGLGRRFLLLLLLRSSRRDHGDGHRQRDKQERKPLHFVLLAPGASREFNSMDTRSSAIASKNFTTPRKN